MGFGGIITTGISIAVLLIAGYLVLAGMSSTLNVATASTAAVREIKADQMATGLTITNITKINDVTVEYNVTNTGSTTIDDLSRMDVILKYFDKGTGQNLAGMWLQPATDNGPLAGSGQWSPIIITSPMKSTTGSLMLMPGETMTVHAVLIAPHPSDTGILQVAAPNGVCAVKPFDFRI